MAFLNKQERDQLAEDLKDKTFQQIRGYINRKDKNARLAYYRNVQLSTHWMTRYVMPTVGTQVTVFEAVDENTKDDITRRKYRIDQIMVEPTSYNQL
jgi:hypothetical protein